ncbi:MAG: kinase-like domain-containing protein [Benjaminiella poitrasii]|nr:MAG: kinase-like domain-containing protein [Benjaminiella poitrasii]
MFNKCQITANNKNSKRDNVKKTSSLHIDTDPLGITFYSEDHAVVSPVLVATTGSQHSHLIPTSASPFPSPSSSSSTVHHESTSFPRRTDVFRNKCQINRRPPVQSLTNSTVTSKSWESIKSPAASFLASFSLSPITQLEDEQEGDEIDDYVLDKIIGQGGFSTVRQGFRISDGQKVAVKIIKRKSSQQNQHQQEMNEDIRLERELSIWKTLEHSNIVHLEKVLETDSATFLVSEYCEGGNLLATLINDTQKLTEAMVRSIFVQLCNAVRYLHEEAKVCHKDLKLENVLLDRDGKVVKLCDFGLAVYQQPQTVVLPPHITAPLSPECLNDLDCAGGSLAYASPEQVRSKRAIACPTTDIWSLGIILYALVTRKLPFSDDFELRLQQKILEGNYEMPTDISSELQDLIRNCLSVDPKTRFTINQVLQSSWCTKSS